MKKGSVIRASATEPASPGLGVAMRNLLGEMERSIGDCAWDTMIKQLDMLFEYACAHPSTPTSALRASAAILLERLHHDNVANQITSVQAAQNADTISELYLLVMDAVATRDRVMKTDTLKAKKKAVKLAIDYVTRNFYRNIGLREIAESVSLAPNYLSHLFKRETGINLTQFVLSVRMSNAEKLVRTTNLRILKISDMSGYAAPSNFGQLFKNTFGVTPARYRELTE